MMSIIPTVSCLLLLVALLSVAPIDGFGVQPNVVQPAGKGSLSSLLSENNRRRSSLSYQNEESPTSSVPTSALHKEYNIEHKSDNVNNMPSTSSLSMALKLDSSDDDDDWDLTEDWALQDSVPRYTVNAATFWTQLRHSTPELSKRTEAELEERYRQWYSSAEDTLLVGCGPAPEMLSDWRVSTGVPVPGKGGQTSIQAATTTMMSGSLPNGSQIWFPLKCAGTLGDDPMSCAGSITQDTLDDCFISASMTMHTSSYAESTGGVVYELGAPRCEAHKVHAHSSQPLAAPSQAHNHVFSSTHAVAHTTADSGDLGAQLDRLQKNFVSEAGKNIGTLSAIVAASTMSACLTLGYATSHLQVIGTPSVNQNRQGDIVTHPQPPKPHGEKIYYSSSSRATEATELTIGEKRARAELKVGRDKRSLVMMQERLQRDESKLTELRTEETRLEAGF